MIPSIKLPSTNPPRWLQHKLRRNDVALSASRSPAPTSTATVKSTAALSGNGCNALSQAVKLWENAEYPVKPFTGAPSTVAFHIRNRKALDALKAYIDQMGDMIAQEENRSDGYLHSDAEHWQKSATEPLYPLDLPTT